MPVRRRIDRRRARRTDIPIVVVDLWMCSGRDYFDDLAEYGLEQAGIGSIADEALLSLWADYGDELATEWGNKRSPFYRHPEDGEPHIHAVLSRLRQAPRAR